MDHARKKELQSIANKIRNGIINSVAAAKSGHPGGSLSIADILAYLYFEEMNIDPGRPGWEDRDRFVLSKGHCAPALYAALALRGYFDESELLMLRKTNKMLQGHPDMKGTPGVDMTTGSLGQGVSAAVGMALSGKIFNKDYRVYAALGDGELEEGQVWEAAMLAAHNKLDNLCIIVDNNGLQIDGKLSQICSPCPIDEKFAAFRFHIIVIDGHDFDEIEQAFRQARTIKGKPTAIIAKTIKGKGVSFMEDNVAWHGAAPDADQHKQALADLAAL